MKNSNYRFLLPFLYGASFTLFFIVILVEWLPLQSFGYNFFEVSIIILPLLILPFMAISCFAFFSKKLRKVSIRILVFGVGVIISFLPAIFLSQKLRIYEFRKLAKRSQIVIDAIKSFEKKEGHPPSNLTELVPNYIESSPVTGMAAYPEYDYYSIGKDWSIQISCGRGVLNWDEFIYRSNGDYSDYSNTTKIDDWIYYHE
jgi:hypothetical protein